MMCFLIFLLSIFSVSIFYTIKIYNRREILFKKEKDILEKIILDLKLTLKLKNEKLKLSEDFKLKLKKSKFELENQILDFNLSMFEELFDKK